MSTARGHLRAIRTIDQGRDDMPRGQKRGWKEKAYQPGTRVPGADNRGILATAAGTFAVYISYANRTTYVGTFPDIPAARAARDAAVADRKGGRTIVPRRKAKTLFGAFASTFLQTTYQKTKRGILKKPSTVRAAASRYRAYLEPFFGALMIEDVTDAQIERFAEKLEAGDLTPPETFEATTEEGTVRRYKPRHVATLSAKSRREILNLLRLILRGAKRARLIAENPFPEDIIPAADHAEIDPPDFETAIAIADAITYLPHRILTYVLLYTGCRLGEAIALRWADIDFTGKRVSIARSADAKTRIAQDPKTKRSRRRVPLDAALAAHLRAYKRAQASGKVPTHDDWLFPSSAPNEETQQFVIDQRNYAQRSFEPARKRVAAKKRVTPHMLRHTWCSMAVQKYPVAYVSKWAGHASVDFTYRVYVQPFEREEARFAQTFSITR